MKLKRILYFVPEWPATTSGVLHSTVLAEAAFLQRNGYDCLLIGADISNEQAAQAQRDIEGRYNLKARIFGCFQRKGFIGVVNLARKVYMLSQDIIKEFKPTHIWTEYFVCSWLGRKMARKFGAVSVFDVPAICAEEIAMLHGYGLKYRICKTWENYELKRTDRLSGVSNVLGQWVERITGRNDMIVIPNCFDEQSFVFSSEARQKIRFDFGFTKADKVICYSGGFSKWQRIRDIVRVCAVITKRTNDFKFMFLTQHINQLKPLLDNEGLDMNRCRLKSCLPSEVPQYLSAADLGIIMRDDVSVNNVASPIKIGEYLGCGLPVLLTKGIGDYSEMIAKAGTGIVLDETGDVAGQIIGFAAKADFVQLREKSASLARETVSWQAQLPHLNQLYI